MDRPERFIPKRSWYPLGCVRTCHESTRRLRIEETGGFFGFPASESQLGLCFPTQEASMVPRDQLGLCDQRCSSSCALLPWIVVPGVQHAYPLTGPALIWGQTHEKNNLSSPRLPVRHWFYWLFFPTYALGCLFICILSQLPEHFVR